MADTKDKSSLATLAVIVVVGIIAALGYWKMDDITDAVSGKGDATLDSLTVREEDTVPGYDRAAFGPAWTDNNTADMGGNGCDTRNDILTRDMKDITFMDGSSGGGSGMLSGLSDGGTKDCRVKSGTLDDPYTGKTINFLRGTHTSSAVQIDHIVALSNAWNSGANLLDYEDRVNLANDPDNLLAADGPSNNAKRDKDASRWLVPDNPKFRCTYVQKQIDIKHRYNLSVTKSEKYAMEEQLKSC